MGCREGKIMKITGTVLIGLGLLLVSGVISGADILYLTDGSKVVGKLQADVVVFEVEGQPLPYSYDKVRAIVTNNPLEAKQEKLTDKEFSKIFEEVYARMTQTGLP